MFESLLHIVALENNRGSPLENIRPFLFVVGIVVAAFMLMRWSQKRIRQNQNRRTLSVQERVDQTRQGLEIYTQIGELMSQLADLSRQINGQIDTRIAKLELLLGEADQTIARLEKISGNNTHINDNSDFHPKQDGIEALRKISEKYHQIGLTQPAETPPSNLDSKPESDVPNLINETQTQKPNKSKILLENQQIIRLSQQGMSSVEIAQKLNRPVGEIELILALNGKKYR